MSRAMVIEILLSMERERFTWNEDLENTENFQFVRKMYFFGMDCEKVQCWNVVAVDNYYNDYSLHIIKVTNTTKCLTISFLNLVYVYK